MLVTSHTITSFLCKTKTRISEVTHSNNSNATAGKQQCGQTLNLQQPYMGATLNIGH